MSFKSLFKYSKQIYYYSIGKQFLNNEFYRYGKEKSEIEYLKTPNRSTILNYLISILKRETVYLEIGVRNPNDNYNKIKANKKYSVDPGVEFKSNPVDFKLTSDDFFAKLHKNEILSDTIKFDVIFIDGLHLAEQVDRDIINALDFIKEDGFVVLHDCNPPTEWHARETFNYHFSPAGGYWNGTTWKAFMKWRFNADIHSCCIDSDSGVGILSKKQAIGDSTDTKNLFFEFSEFDKNRKEYLNLISFDVLKKILE